LIIVSGQLNYIKSVGFMLFLCQLLLNFQGAQALIQVRSLSYRIKSIQSVQLKYNRYYPDHQTGKVFNDMLGFRTLCDNYDEVLEMAECEYIRVADMSKGKS
jgi:ppGpp synthetase/RelA/SpoT-type nucleotidyltranferase